MGRTASTRPGTEAFGNPREAIRRGGRPESRPPRAAVTATSKRKQAVARSSHSDPCASREVLSRENDVFRVRGDVDHESDEPEIEAGFVHDEEAAVRPAAADESTRCR